MPFTDRVTKLRPALFISEIPVSDSLHVQNAAGGDLNPLLTFVIATSPSKIHPKTCHIDTVLKSLPEHFRIVVAADFCNVHKKPKPNCTTYHKFLEKIEVYQNIEVMRNNPNRTCILTCNLLNVVEHVRTP